MTPYRLSDWGSHLPVLAGALHAVGGPFLELGVGNFSNDLAALMGVEDHWVVEPPGTWRSSRTWHGTVVDSEDHLPQRKWGVVLVDQAPAGARVASVLRFLHHARVIVLHDTDDAMEYLYGYGRLWGKVPYARRWNGVSPTTSVISAHENDLAWATGPLWSPHNP